MRGGGERERGEDREREIEGKKELVSMPSQP